MPKLFALILVLVGAVGGGAGGYFAKQMLSGDAPAEDHEEADAHGGGKNDAKAKEADGAHGDKHEPTGTDKHAKKGGKKDHGKANSGKKGSDGHGG